MQDTLLVLDFDTYSSGLVTRLLRGQQLNCTLLKAETSLEGIRQLSPRGIILASPNGATSDLRGMDMDVLSMGVPVLALGATAAALCVREGGACESLLERRASTNLELSECDLLSEVSGGERVLHGASLLTLPDSLQAIATADGKPIGYQHRELPLYAMEYPIERNDPDAVQILRNFACLICNMQPNWDSDAIIEHAIASIREQVGSGLALCAVSGGVDSAVSAKLCHMALGDRLICVCIDTGLFRNNECEYVISSFMESMGIVVAYVDAQDAFLHALSGVSKPEDKERIASSLLSQVLLKQLSFETEVSAIVMGTNFNDYTTGGAEPQRLSAPDGRALPVIEPVRELFKDEVRQLARALALPATICDRQPFPSSGLALRILGEVTKERLDVLRQADALFGEEVRAGGHDRKLWQYFAMLSPNPEKEGYVILLRALQAAQEGAVASRMPYDLLERVTERILSTLPSVNRVIYDLTPSQRQPMME